MSQIGENEKKEISEQLKPENLVTYFPGFGEPVSKEEIERIRQSAARALALIWED